LERPRAEGMAQMGFYLAGTASAGLAVLAAAMAFVPLDIAGFVKLRPIDPPFFLLASTTFGAVALFVSRSIPTLHVLFGDERTYYTGDNYFSRTKSVVMPALMALTMLLLVVLVLMLLGAGLAGLAGDIPQNHFLLGLLGFVAVALLFTGTMALRLAKSEDQVKLYRQGRSLEQRQSLIILGASGAVASVCALLAGLLYFRVSVLGIPQTRWIDFLCFTLLALCGPYGFWMNRKNKRMRSLEARFPDFLRDLAASRKAGLTLTAAVQNAARGEYGALTPEIRTMADQLSWDVPFEEALAGFGKRVRTPLVERSVSLIIEASRSGGNVNDVLMAAANDARELKNLEHERGSTMSIYTMVIYITFAVFLAVVAVLYGTFIPQILSSGQAIAAKGGAGKFGGITVGNLTLEGYRVFYFLAAVVQGMGNGFVAGVIGSGKVMDGMRHAFVLVLIAYLTFSVILGGG
jgi:flagellar protein FlaJ